MTVEEVLTAEGYTAEESKALTDNPKNKGLLTKILAQSDAGQTALLKAQALEQDIRKFNDETVIPYGAKKDAEAAQARAEAAKYQTYLKSLKDSGYDIPDAYLAAAPNVNVEPVKVEPKYVQASDLDNQGKAYMSLLSLSEKARDLLGHGLDIESEYEDFGKNKRPNENLRAYVDRKYDLTSKETARKEKTKFDYEEKLRKEGEERYQKANPRTANDELQTARASKFDRFQKLPDESKNLHQTLAGREKATQNRLEKYRDLLVQ